MLVGMAAKHPHLTDALRKGIKGSELTQAQIAARLGVTQATVSRWARGEMSPDRELWPAIEALLGLSLPGYEPEAVGDHEARISQLEDEVRGLLLAVRELQGRAVKGANVGTRPGRRSTAVAQ